MVSFSIAFIAVASLAVPAIAAPTIPQGNILAGLRGSRLVAAATMVPLNITYTFGAPVLTEPLNLYYIYYGNWADSQKAIVEDFTRGLGTSQWYGITKQYYYQESATSPKIYVNDKVTLAATVVDNYSLGKSLSGNALPDIIQAQIDSGKLPEDTNGVYIVLTAGDVTESIRADFGGASFCTAYCGYHVSWQVKSGKRIYYAMVGIPTACLNGCAPPQNQNISPNADPGVDAMLSALAHEISEAVTDPWSDGTRAWQDSTGNENGDKCAFNFGATSLDANGATYNLNWSGRNFMIQQMWDNVEQACRVTPAGIPELQSQSSTTQAAPASTSAAPSPSPSPVAPSPSSSPSPAPEPSPASKPSPSPASKPSPSPASEPSPSPAPEPSPEPSPASEPEPIPGPEFEQYFLDQPTI